MRGQMRRGAWISWLAATTSLALGGCATTTPAPGAPAVTARVETEPTAQAGANSAALALDGDLARSIVIGSGESGGIEIYGLDGARRGGAAAGDVAGLDIRYGVPLNGGAITLLAALDAEANALRFFQVQDGALTEISARPVPIGFAGESVCLWRDARSGAVHAFALGGAGEIGQFSLFDAGGGRVDARLVRRLHLASEAAYCAADDASGALYVTEQGVGLWRFNADAESENVPVLIDARRLGAITEEAGGVAVQGQYLIASDASANAFHVYDRANEYVRVGSFTIGAGAHADGVEAAGGLFASSVALPGYPNGVFIAMDDDNEGGPNYKLVDWGDIANALGLAGARSRDPRTIVRSDYPVVRPSIETEPVETGGDAADDPAVWVHPADPSLSLIIGTQKQSGLYVYDLSGARVQFLPDGRMNNVDLRYNFTLGGERVAIVAATNRTNHEISLYRVDADARQLVNAAAGPAPTGFADPYGLCMYQSARDGATYVFAGDTEGAMRQWRLSDENGRVRATLVREFSFASQAEGCVADDATGILYVAEEDHGLWRLNAEPDGGDARTQLDSVADNPAIKDDLEGVAIYDLGDGRGYLVLSSQGNDSYAVYDRQSGAYIGSFAVIADEARGIDGVSETDGLEVTSAALGPGFPHGAFVAQDGRNVSPPEHQNFKLVPWERIAAALGLDAR